MVPDDHFGPIVSLIVAGLMLLVPGAGFVFTLVTALRFRVVALTATRPPRDGKTIVHGKVAYASSESLAMRVEIDQVGSESEGSGGWSHAWKETKRRVKVAPFYVVDDDGTRVRVGPTPEAFLVDDLDGKIIVSTFNRQRFAELVPDEEVWVSGELQSGHDPEAHGGYRGSSESKVLRAPRGGQLLVSSEPLDRQYRARARIHFIWAFGFLAGTVFNTALAESYFDRLGGETTTGVVTFNETIIDSENDSIRGYDVTIKGTFGQATNRLENAEPLGKELPARAGRRDAQIGSKASFGQGYIVCVLGALGIWLAYVLHAMFSMPWYRQSVNDSGRGRLETQSD